MWAFKPAGWVAELFLTISLPPLECKQQQYYMEQDPEPMPVEDPSPPLSLTHSHGRKPARLGIEYLGDPGGQTRLRFV